MKRTPNAKRREKIEARKPVRAEQLARYPYCEAKAMEHRCYGGLTMHEPWTKARGGPTDDLRNAVTLCAEANRLVSQDSRCMAWAEEHGMLVSAAQGPAWLAAGGYRRT
ncbi:MAG: hypothetical protein WC211_03770 [Dehalococcoidia bacterium]